MKQKHLLLFFVLFFNTVTFGGDYGYEDTSKQRVVNRTTLNVNQMTAIQLREIQNSVGVPVSKEYFMQKEKNGQYEIKERFTIPAGDTSFLSRNCKEHLFLMQKYRLPIFIALAMEGPNGIYPNLIHPYDGSMFNKFNENCEQPIIPSTGTRAENVYYVLALLEKKNKSSSNNKVTSDINTTKSMDSKELDFDKIDINKINLCATKNYKIEDPINITYVGSREDVSKKTNRGNFINVYELALQREQKNFKSLLKLGLLYKQKLKNTKKAQNYFEYIISLNPKTEHEIEIKAKAIEYRIDYLKNKTENKHSVGKIVELLDLKIKNAVNNEQREIAKNEKIQYENRIFLYGDKNERIKVVSSVIKSLVSN